MKHDEDSIGTIELPIKRVRRENGNVIWLTCLSCAILLICLASFIRAGQEKNNAGYDAYWQNRIALASDATFIDDDLVEEFLAASESFDTDTATGELLTGAMRRSVGQSDNMGWLMKVVKQTEVKTEAGTTHKFYNIEMFLVFDLGTSK